ncbi:MAG TPA: hypothetical protein VF292_02805 [Rhodanobacteraceae bacterium]
MPKIDLPYYKRHDLLKQVMTILTSGLKSSVTLFAHRRQGKTAFIDHELLPEAFRRGWQGVYINLWRRRSEPELALVEGLEAAVAELGPEKVHGKWKLQKARAAVKVGMTGVEVGAAVEAERGSQVDPSRPLENRLASAIDNLVGEPILLLVFDEFQALAGSDQDDFVAALRTALARHEGEVLVFYTGSSRAGLNTMFQRQRAPLFASSMPIDLPVLGRGFVVSRAELLKRRTGIEADIGAMDRLFGKVLRTPEFMNEITLWLMVYAHNGDTAELDRAYREWLVRLRDTAIGHTLATLAPVREGVMLLLADTGHPGLFSAQAHAWIQNYVGARADVTKSKIQAAIRWLQRNGLVVPMDGGVTRDYEVDDYAARIYLRERVRSR